MTYLAKTIDANLTPDEIRQRVKDWYDRQIAIISKAHGPSWPEHKEWIDAYLGEEIRMRLLELGWRAKE